MRQTLCRGLIFLLLEIVVSPAAGHPPPLDPEDEAFVGTVAERVGVATPNIATTSQNGLVAEKSGTIAMGPNFFRALSKVTGDGGRRMAIRFALAHEIWHLRQYADQQAVGGDARNQKECEADGAAAYLVTSLTLSMTGQARADNTTMERLRDVAAMRTASAQLLDSVQSDAQHHGQLTPRQREISIFFGMNRALYEWSQARQSNSDIPARQIYEYSRRFIPESKISPPEYVSAVCTHITQQNSDALRDLLIFDMPGDLENPGRQEARQSGETEVRNFGRRAIRYSFIGISGITPTQATGQPNVPLYVDSVWHSVDVAPGEVKKIKTSIGFPLVRPDKGVGWTLMGQLNGDTLVSASYIGPEPTVQNCAERVQSGIHDPILLALFRLGGAAPERFISLHKKKKMSLGDSSTFELVISLPGAKAEAFEGAEGDAFATIDYAPLGQLQEAERLFDQAVKSIRSVCSPILDDEKVDRTKEGLPRFSISRLTSRSSAFIRIAERKYEGKPNLFYVTWFVTPTGRSEGR